MTSDVEDRVVPVSYTHLDVYKRQEVTSNKSHKTLASNANETTGIMKEKPRYRRLKKVWPRDGREL